MPAEIKVQTVKELREKFESAEAVVLADYRGLTVEDVTDLRAKCREAGVEFRVAKNRLAKIALREGKLPTLDEHLIGPTAFAFGFDDPVTPAKVIADFCKTNEKIEIKAGLVAKEAVDLDVINRLAALPSRDELLARLAGSLSAPMRDLAGVLQAIPGGLARAIRAVADQREAA